MSRKSDRWFSRWWQVVDRRTEGRGPHMRRCVLTFWLTRNKKTKWCSLHVRCVHWWGLSAGRGNVLCVGRNWGGAKLEPTKRHTCLCTHHGDRDGPEVQVQSVLTSALNAVISVTSRCTEPGTLWMGVWATLRWESVARGGYCSPHRPALSVVSCSL